MATIDVVTGATRTGVAVQRATGRAVDAARAAGLSAWFGAATGRPLAVDVLPDGKARLRPQDEAQAQAMRQWLVSSLTKPKDPDARLQVDLGTVFRPLAVRYGLLAGGTVLIGGVILGMVVDNL